MKKENLSDSTKKFLRRKFRKTIVEPVIFIALLCTILTTVSIKYSFVSEKLSIILGTVMFVILSILWIFNYLGQYLTLKQAAEKELKKRHD